MSLNLNLSTSKTPADDGNPGGKKKKRKIELPIVSIKNTADYQRMKLERLMANPDKPVQLPHKPKEKNLPPPPDFVRNVMGSSAGAGSGEFHVYRHLRRKEFARQKGIQEAALQDSKDEEFRRKIEDNKMAAEEKTAKKRAKRLKKKMKQKQKKNQKGSSNGRSSQSEEDDSEDEEETENGEKSSNNNNDAEENQKEKE